MACCFARGDAIGLRRPIRGAGCVLAVLRPSYGAPVFLSGLLLPRGAARRKKRPPIQPPMIRPEIGHGGQHHRPHLPPSPETKRVEEGRSRRSDTVATVPRTKHTRRKFVKSVPLFPVTMVGSWTRSPELLRAQSRKQRGKISAAEFERVADKAVLETLRLQEEAGVDLVTDGEQRRDNFYSFVAEKLDGVRLMSLAEMLDLIEDKDGFERILQTLDVPAFSIRNPTCVGRVRRRQPLAEEEYRFLRRHTDRPIKIPLPG